MLRCSPTKLDLRSWLPGGAALLFSQPLHGWEQLGSGGRGAPWAEMAETPGNARSRRSFSRAFRGAEYNGLYKAGRHAGGWMGAGGCAVRVRQRQGSVNVRLFVYKHVYETRRACRAVSDSTAASRMNTAVMPLKAALELNVKLYGCCTNRTGDACEAFVVDGTSIVPLLGADQRTGLALGERRQLQRASNSAAELGQVFSSTLAAPLWDPFTGSVFGLPAVGAAVVRLLPDNSCVVVAGHLTELGEQEGPGLSARFTIPKALSTDGNGTLYLVDSQHVWKLQLPASWRQTTSGQGLTSGPTAASAAAAAEGGQASGQAASGAQGQGPRPHQQERTEILASILPTGQPGVRYSSVTYEPRSNALILASRRAVYRRPLAEGCAEQPVLLAGCNEESGHRDGMGAEARFNLIFGGVLDETGRVILLDFEWEAITTAVRVVAPDGTVTTPACDLPGSYFCPNILPNGYLALCNSRAGLDDGERPELLVLDLGLTPNACHTAANPTQSPAGPRPHSLPADLSALLASAGQPDGGTADMVVEVGGRGFPAHRAVLGARSAYFRQRLDPGAGFGESGAQRLSLLDASPEAFEVALRYMYTDSAGDVPGALLQPAAELADRLLLPGLCEEVGRQMLAAVCAESVVGLLLWAEQRSASFGGLLRGLKAWFGEHREEVLALPGHTKRLMTEGPDLAYELICEGPGAPRAKRQRVQ